MNLQNIERLQRLLSRVEQNAKRPRMRTQGLGASVGGSSTGPASPAALAGPAAPTAVSVDRAAPAAKSAPLAAATPAAKSAPLAAATPAVKAAPVAAPAPFVVPTSTAATTAKTPAKPVEPAAAALPPEKVVSLTPEMATSLPPDSLPAELLEIDVTESLQDMAAAQPPPIEDVSLDEISGVELQPESLDEIPIEDMSVDDIGVEIGSAVTCDVPTPADTAGVAPFTAPPSLDDLTFSEPPPPDSPRQHRLGALPVSEARDVSEPPGSIDAALLAATEAQANAADAREIDGPALTPPPESGPQVAVPPIASPAIPKAPLGETAAYREAAPTMEQLGEVIELDQASGPPLELAERGDLASNRVAAKATPEELEFVPQRSVPSRPTDAREPMQTLVGGFTDEYDTGSEPIDTPPPPARFVVPGVGQPRSEPPVPAPVEPPSYTMPATGLDFGDEAPTASSVLSPEIVARAPIARAKPALDVIAAARSFRPQSFLELLDASMGLMKK